MKKQKTLVLLLIFAMALSLLPQSAFAAKKKVKLNKKTVTVNAGKTVKIKLQNNKKKVKWTVISGKKNVTLSKKKKTGVTIKGKKPGTAKVQALKYHVGNIRRELVKGLSIGDDYKIVKMINDAFQKQTPIAKNKAKERLQEIYDTLGLQRKAKATDLVQ